MSKKDFEDMLNRHGEVKKQDEIDWNAQKDEWISFIKQFYSSVEGWLAPYVEQQKLAFDYKKTTLSEEHIGTYDVDTMNINFAGQQIKIEPVGTLLIGTKGRIDMEGARGRVQFILADKDSKGIKVSVSISLDGKPKEEQQKPKEPNWTWKIVLRNSRKISYEDFTEENFFNGLMEIING
jgi:hypothetical protein